VSRIDFKPTWEKRRSACLSSDAPGNDYRDVPKPASLAPVQGSLMEWIRLSGILSGIQYNGQHPSRSVYPPPRMAVVKRAPLFRFLLKCGSGSA